MSAGKGTPKAARRSHKPPRQTRRQEAAVAEALSDRATLLLIRKTLCPETLSDKDRDDAQPIEELLPPLTSSNEIDLQIYAFLSIILRDFVQNWYNKITPDETFVLEIVQVIAHCTRALEDRLRHIDLESLLLDELPDLLDRHITAYRASHAAFAASPLQASPREAYHALFPLPQLSPVPDPENKDTIAKQAENETAYRQLLVEGMLSILLPNEELENPCETALVSQILSELIIGNLVINKASQPWLLYESICTVSRVLRERGTDQGERAVSGASEPSEDVTEPYWSIQRILFSMLHFGIIIMSGIRLLVETAVWSSKLPSRLVSITASKSPNQKPTKIAVLDFKLWTCVGNLIQLSFRMPWLSGFVSLLQYQAVHGPGRIAGLDARLDRLLSHGAKGLFPSTRLAPMLRTIRGVVFPNNAQGTPSLFPPKSDEEFLALRERAAASLLALVPRHVVRVYFGQDDQAAGSSDKDRQPATTDPGLQAAQDLLMIINDEYCNKHLLYGILEIVIVRLMPELAEKGVTDLRRERLGDEHPATLPL